eukprot:6852684-Prymnesium_polylepis.1
MAPPTPTREELALDERLAVALKDADDESLADTALCTADGEIEALLRHLETRRSSAAAAASGSAPPADETGEP